MSVAVLALLGSASLFTSFVSGILGMAGGMMLMGILIAVMPVPAAMTLHGITQLASNGNRAWMLRREIHWATIRRVSSRETELVPSGLESMCSSFMVFSCRGGPDRPVEKNCADGSID